MTDKRCCPRHQKKNGGERELCLETKKSGIFSDQGQSLGRRQPIRLNLERNNPTVKYSG